MIPTTPAEFDSAYRAPFTFWGDFRIPPEIDSLVRQDGIARVLELGCGVGRFSRHVARLGRRVTAVDFSPVAIAKARVRVKGDADVPDFQVGDVTHLDGIDGPFDASFDVGCFHCLGVDAQRAYASEMARLLRPGGIHLIWALDDAPADLALDPHIVEQIFAASFEFTRTQSSRRRLARSHWYWLTRR